MGRGRQYSWMNAGRKWEPCDNLQCFKPISISGDCFSLIPEEHLKAIIFVFEVVLSPTQSANSVPSYCVKSKANLKFVHLKLLIYRV